MERTVQFVLNGLHNGPRYIRPYIFLVTPPRGLVFSSVVHLVDIAWQDIIARPMQQIGFRNKMEHRFWYHSILIQNGTCPCAVTSGLWQSSTFRICRIAAHYCTVTGLICFFIHFKVAKNPYIDVRFGYYII